MCCNPLFHSSLPHRPRPIYKLRYSFPHAQQHKHMNSAQNDSLNLPFYPPLYRYISKTFACTLLYKLHQHTKKLQEQEVCCVGRTASVSSLTKCVYAALHADCALYTSSVWPHKMAAVKMKISCLKLAGCYIYRLR